MSIDTEFKVNIVSSSEIYRQLEEDFSTSRASGRWINIGYFEGLPGLFTKGWIDIQAIKGEAFPRFYLDATLFYAQLNQEWWSKNEAEDLRLELGLKHPKIKTAIRKEEEFYKRYLLVEDPEFSGGLDVSLNWTGPGEARIGQIMIARQILADPSLGGSHKIHQKLLDGLVREERDPGYVRTMIVAAFERKNEWSLPLGTPADFDRKLARFAQLTESLIEVASQIKSSPQSGILNIGV